MKKLSIFAAVVVAAASAIAQDAKYELSDYRNYCGLGWTSSAKDLVKYAQNMGYSSVMYMYGMEKLKLDRDLKFFLESPEYTAYSREFYADKTYTKRQIDEWLKYCAVAFPEKPFPECMATGWFFDKNRYCLLLDMQQKAVHDFAIKRIMDKVAKIAKVNPRLKFGGFTWDVPQPYGDFNYYVAGKSSRNRQTTLKHWTGSDSTPERAGIKHDYPTYYQGYFEFYRAIFEAGRKFNPDAKFIVEPYKIYSGWVSYFAEPYMKSKGADAKKYMADFIMAEGNGTDFIEDKKIFADGKIKKSDVCSSTPDVFKEKDMREIAVAAATNGAWTCFFGRYGGYDSAPLCRSIRDIPARIKLGKAVATWENLNNTPLSQRKFENGVYSSPTAYVSADVYWAKQPETDRIIAVFITERGVLKIPEGWQVSEICHLDGLFSECGKVPKGVLKRNSGTIAPAEPSVCGSAFSIRLKKL